MFSEKKVTCEPTHCLPLAVSASLVLAEQSSQSGWPNSTQVVGCIGPNLAQRSNLTLPKKKKIQLDTMAPRESFALTQTGLIFSVAGRRESRDDVRCRSRGAFAVYCKCETCRASHTIYDFITIACWADLSKRKRKKAINDTQ